MKIQLIQEFHNILMNLQNNKLRLYPVPSNYSMPDKFYIRFTVKRDSWKEYADKKNGGSGR